MLSIRMNIAPANRSSLHRARTFRPRVRSPGRCMTARCDRLRRSSPALLRERRQCSSSTYRLLPAKIFQPDHLIPRSRRPIALRKLSAQSTKTEHSSVRPPSELRIHRTGLRARACSQYGRFDARSHQRNGHPVTVSDLAKVAGRPEETEHSTETRRSSGSASTIAVTPPLT